MHDCHSRLVDYECIYCYDRKRSYTLYDTSKFILKILVRALFILKEEWTV